MGERFQNNSFNAKKVRERETSLERSEPEERERRKLDTPAMKIKTPLSRKFMDTFVQGDIKSVMSHIIQDIIIPSAIETLGDMGHNLVDGMIYGDDASSRSRRRRNRNRETSSLDRSRGTTRLTREQSMHNPRTLRFDDIAFDTKDQAKDAIADLRETIEYYNRPASVTDLYYFIGWDRLVDHTTNRYGWYEISDRVRPERIWVNGEEKWTITLPRAEFIGDD